MANSLRQLEGSLLSGVATRTETAIDDVDMGGATFKAKAKSKILGAGALYAVVGHDEAAGTLTAMMGFYDRDDNLISVGSVLTFAATTATATLSSAEIPTQPNARFLSASQIEVPTGAWACRLNILTLTTSTEFDIFVQHDDGFTR